MIERICQQCGKPFLTYPSRIRIGKGLYCSQSCFGEATRGPKSSLAERFWSSVDKSAGPEGCWLWIGCKDPSGYGRINVGDDRTAFAHRTAYDLTNGPIPKGMYVLHNCPGGKDNPGCVNPAHLWLGTHADNMHDARRKRQLCVPHLEGRGEKNHSAKLTETAVLEIRAARASGESLKALAARFGVCMGTISDVARRNIWKHI